MENTSHFIRILLSGLVHMGLSIYPLDLYSYQSSSRLSVSLSIESSNSGEQGSHTTMLAALKFGDSQVFDIHRRMPQF